MTIDKNYALHTVAIRVSTCRADISAMIDRRLWRYRAEAESNAPKHFRYVDRLESANGSSVGRVVCQTPVGTASYVDADDVLVADLLGTGMQLRAREGVAWFAGGEWTADQRYLATQTLTTIALMEFARRDSLWPVHAAALARGTDGVVIPGASGVGKSTLSLAMARRGWEYLCDDLVFLESAGAQTSVSARGFADAVGVRASTPGLLPEIVPACAAPIEAGYRKHMLDVESLFGADVRPDCVPRAIVFPEIVDGPHSRLEPMTSTDGWLRLVPNVWLTDAEVTQGHLSAISRLIEQAPCYRLCSGNDLDESVELIESVL